MPPRWSSTSRADGNYTARQLLAGGFDLRNTAARLGHSGGGATTQRHYADPLPEVDRRAAAYLSQLTAGHHLLTPAQALAYVRARCGRPDGHRPGLSGSGRATLSSFPGKAGHTARPDTVNPVKGTLARRILLGALAVAASVVAVLTTTSPSPARAVSDAGTAVSPHVVIVGLSGSALE